MQPNAKKNSWIVILPVALAAAAYVYWIYIPGRRAIAELHEQIRAKQDFVAEAEKSLQSLHAGKKELKKTAAYVAACRCRAADEKELDNILSIVHAAADQAKVRVTRFDPQQTTSYECVRRVPVTIGLTGQFAQVHEFFRSLEEIPAYIWIESMKIELDVKTGKDVTGELSLIVFVGNSENSSYALCSE